MEIALIDCNSFFVACEQVFDLSLRGKAVVVLSSNDGCVVARSKEAKAVPVAMGVPLFEIRHLVDRGRVIARSANFTLYGDLSGRVMTTLAEFGHTQEVYSIDECFLNISHAPDPVAAMRLARSRVLRDIGITTSIGIGPTKTLAKLAGEIAKKQRDGVFRMPPPGPDLAAVLATLPMAEVWGLGPSYRQVMSGWGAVTALDVARLSTLRMRRRFGTVGERIIRELRGERCLLPETTPPPKQSITVSRSFGIQVSEEIDLRAAVGVFVEQAAMKARQQQLAASAMTVWVSSNRFDPQAPDCGGSWSQTFPVATNLTSELLKAADVMVRRLWTPGGRWKKAGVTLLGLVSAESRQQSFLDPVDHVAADALMATVDRVNTRFGRSVVRFGPGCLSDHWRPLAGQRSPRFTTRWEEVLEVR